nr:hypothetical protein [uncultured Draconibacterium sp.]
MYNSSDLVDDISKNGKTLWAISWRVFLMIFSIIGFVGIVTGFNFYGKMKAISSSIETRIEKEFEKPQIEATVQKVAAVQARSQMDSILDPEVKRFSARLNELENKTDSVIQNQMDEFTMSLEVKYNLLNMTIENIYDEIASIEKAKDEILAIEEEMQEIKEYAKPPILIFKELISKSKEDCYRLRPVFTSSKNSALGLITFTVTLLNSDSELLLIDNDPEFGGLSYDGKTYTRILGDKQVGVINYALIGGTGYPSVIFEISKKSKVKIESNYLPEPYYIELEDY